MIKKIFCYYLGFLILLQGQFTLPYLFTKLGYDSIGFIFSINWYEKVFPESRALSEIFSNLKTGQLGKIGRISGFWDIMSKVEKDLSNLFFGWGPGSSFAGNYIEGKGLIYEFPIQAKNQLAETFVDIGFIGMLAYYWLLIRLLSIFKKQIKLELE